MKIVNARLYLGILALFALCLCGLSAYLRGTECMIEAVIPINGKFQLFWGTDSNLFTEANSSTQRVAKGERVVTYSFHTSNAFVSGLRIDPIDGPTTIQIASVRVGNGFFSRIFTPQDLLAELRSTNQVGKIEVQDNKLIIQTLGNDPHIILPLQGHVQNRVMLVSLFVVAAICVFVLAATRRERLLKSRLTRRTWFLATTVALLVGFGVSVSCKLHGSSFHAWYDHYPRLFFRSSVPLFGEPRAVRSDEWLVHTPSIISQARLALPFDTTNPSVGAGAAPMLMGLPTRHLSTIFRPQYWGFFLFEVERGFSWWWSFRVFGCLLGVYLMLYALTRGRSGISLAGSLWFYFSDFTQWWLSSGVPEMVAAFSMGFFFLYTGIRARAMPTLLASACGTLFSATSFMLQMYPPFQIPLIWFGVALLFSVLSSPGIRRRARILKAPKVVAFAIIAITTLGVLYGHYRAISESATILSQSAYPGDRFERGGNFSLARYFSGFGSLILSETTFPQAFGNISEGSSFFLVWPLLLPSFLFFGDRPMWRRSVPIVAFLLAMSLYTLVGWPSWLCALTLMKMVPAGRAMLSIGLATVCLTCVYFASVRTPQRSGILFGLLLLALSMVGWCLTTEQVFGDFFSLEQYCFGLLTMLLLGLPIVYKNRVVFSVNVVILCLFPGISVNPIHSGLAPLLHNRVTDAVRIISRDSSGSKWIVFGDFVLPSLFKAAGAPVLNGSKYVPDLDMWRVIDPSERFMPLYNRYAHFQFQPAKDGSPPDIELIQADLVTVRIAPCAPELEKLHANVLVLPRSVRDRDLSCLRKIPTGLDQAGFSVYVRASGAEAHDH